MFVCYCVFAGKKKKKKQNFFFFFFLLRFCGKKKKKKKKKKPKEMQYERMIRERWAVSSRLEIYHHQQWKPATIVSIAYDQKKGNSIFLFLCVRVCVFYGFFAFFLEL